MIQGMSAEGHFGFEKKCLGWTVLALSAGYLLMLNQALGLFGLSVLLGATAHYYALLICRKACPQSFCDKPCVTLLQDAGRSGELVDPALCGP